MAFTFSVSREPGYFTEESAGRPLLKFQPKTVHTVIDADPTLTFEPDEKNPQYGTIIYSGNPKREEFEKGESAICFDDGTLSAKNPSDALVKKMLDLSVRLNAYLLDDGSLVSFCNSDGVMAHHPELKDDFIIIGDKGTHYAINTIGQLKELNLIPDYLAENFASFSEEARKNFIKKAPVPSGCVPVYGPTAAPCSTFVKFYEENNREFVVVYYEACLGFISGWNFANKDNPENLIPFPENIEAMTNEDILFLYGYCKSFPRTRFALACCAFMKMRSGKALKIPNFI